ncbi:hypothetical protein EMPS_07608 [Entomortierella parvispora]|uniref:Uncharacterized protein n=1 Tax=Entomortierella parvispora TaxID=205924 RepID=A0A9P3LYU8_9FUNG|nr:hypothetical protein EMPS_07608 [Entomortierella parvispora]
MSSQYYRVKRQKHTFFINSANPSSETILSLKQKLLKALQASATHLDAAAANVRSTADLKLSIPSKKDPHLFEELIDSKTAAASGLVDQQMIALTLKTQAGTWEPVEIAQPESVTDLDDLEDEPEEAPRSKGKGRAH